MSDDLNQPAFPILGGLHEHQFPGMSLRHYFAAHAPTPAEPMPLAEHCAYRYRYADAMLAAGDIDAPDSKR